jgi:hypothetical protein
LHQVCTDGEVEDGSRTYAPSLKIYLAEQTRIEPASVVPGSTSVGTPES